MIKRVRFYPYPANKIDNSLYSQLLERLNENSLHKKELSFVKYNKKRQLQLISHLIWNFLNANRDKIEPRIRNYFKIRSRIGYSILFRAFMPKSYEKYEPNRVGFVIEVADLICKFVESDPSMTFYKWTNSKTPSDLEQYLTSFYKKGRIIDVNNIYSDSKIVHREKRDNISKDQVLSVSSNKMINYLKYSANNYHSVFISYSHKDERFVLRLYNDLQSNGVKCWYAPKDLLFGDKFRDKIEDAIQIYDKLIIVLSSHSISSGWVEDEVETAMEREYANKDKILIPVRIDNSIFKSKVTWNLKIKRTRHIGDFSNSENYVKSFEKLLKSLNKKTV